MIKVFYQDRKGAHCMRQFRDIEQAGPFLQTLRCEATAKDETGAVIGEVWLLKRGDPGYGVDKRRKWGYWFDPGRPLAATAQAAEETE